MQTNLKKDDTEKQKYEEFKEISKGLGIDTDLRIINEKNFGAKFEAPKSKIEVMEEILAGKKVSDKTTQNLFKKGRVGDSITLFQEQLEKDLQKTPDIGKALKLFTVSAAKPFFQIAQGGGAILAPALQQGNFEETKKRAIKTTTDIGGGLAYQLMNPTQTLVGLTKSAINKPISFSGELAGSTALFGSATNLGLINKAKVLTNKLNLTKQQKNVFGKTYKKITKEEKRIKDYKSNYLTDSIYARQNISNLYQKELTKNTLKMTNELKQKTVYSDYATMVKKIERDTLLKKARQTKLDKLSPEQFYKKELAKQKKIDAQINKDMLKLIEEQKPNKLKTINFKELKKQRLKELKEREINFYDIDKLKQFGEQYNKTIETIENKTILKEIEKLKFEQDKLLLQAQRELTQSRPKTIQKTSLYEVKQTAKHLRKIKEFVNEMDKRQLLKKELKEKKIAQQERAALEKLYKHEYELGIKTERLAQKRQRKSDIDILTNKQPRKKIITAKDLFPEQPAPKGNQIATGRTIQLTKTIPNPQIKQEIKIKPKTFIQEQPIPKPNKKIKIEKERIKNKQREPTTTKLTQKQQIRVIQLIKTKLEQDSLNKTQTILKPSVVPALKNTQNQINPAKQRIQQRTATKQIQSQLMRQTQGLVITQSQLRQTTLPQTKLKIVTKSLIKLKPRTKPKINRPIQKEQAKTKNQTKLYISQVREKDNTRWKTVSKPNPYNKSFNKGLEVADNTIAQSVRNVYKKTVKRNIPDDPYINDFKFRNKKRKSKIPANPVKIEKRGYAIDTLGEKQKLSVAKYLAQQKGINRAKQRFINNKSIRLL